MQSLQNLQRFRNLKTLDDLRTLQGLGMGIKNLEVKPRKIPTMNKRSFTWSGSGRNVMAYDFSLFF